MSDPLKLALKVSDGGFRTVEWATVTDDVAAQALRLGIDATALLASVQKSQERGERPKTSLVVRWRHAIPSLMSRLDGFDIASNL